MSQRTIAWRHLAAVGLLSLLGACAQNPPQAQNPQQPVASNPPPVAPGSNAIWYTVNFDTNSFAINADGQKVVSDVITFLQSHPTSVATIIGRTDTVGSNDYNMRLSHRRADAVRDALVYGGKLSEDRVERAGPARPDKACQRAIPLRQRRTALLISPSISSRQVEVTT